MKTPATILLAEDDLLLQRSVSSFLGDTGYQVLSAGDGTLAWKLFQEHDADLLVTDLRMPGMDGLELLGRVLQRKPGTPVIILSGAGTMDDAIEALRSGAWDYLTKPLQYLSRLAHTVERALEHRRLQLQEQQHLQQLEREVERRTRELARANVHLQKEMMQRLETQERLIQADKMITLGTLVSGVAHEINNPNNLIMLNIPFFEQVLEAAAPLFEKRYEQEGDFLIGRMHYSRVREKLPDLLTGMLDGSRRIKQIVADLKRFAVPEPEELSQEVDLEQVVHTAASLLGNLIEKSCSRFTITSEKALPGIKGNAQRLEQVVINLLHNSCMALGDPKQTISVRIGRTDGQDALFIEVRDEGEGIPPENLKQITDPFFTTRRSSGGTGLGLAVSYRIVRKHGGRLEFHSQPGKGTTARVLLPIPGEGA